MKLVTYRACVEAESRLGLVEGGLVVDVARLASAHGAVLAHRMLDFIDLGPTVVKALNEMADRSRTLWPAGVALPIENVKLLAPIPRPRKNIFGIGLNDVEHVEESSRTLDTSKDVVTADAIPDPHNLDLWLTVNGKEKQRANTRHLLFDIPTLIADISAGITLEPGDIIATGTPSGVGADRVPQEWLVAGRRGRGVCRRNRPHQKPSCLGELTRVSCAAAKGGRATPNVEADQFVPAEGWDRLLERSQ